MEGCLQRAGCLLMHLGFKVKIWNDFVKKIPYHKVNRQVEEISKPLARVSFLKINKKFHKANAAMGKVQDGVQSPLECPKAWNRIKKASLRWNSQHLEGGIYMTENDVSGGGFHSKEAVLKKKNLQNHML